VIDRQNAADPIIASSSLSTNAGGGQRWLKGQSAWERVLAVNHALDRG
jgi:hypothetical protein